MESQIESAGEEMKNVEVAGEVKYAGFWIRWVANFIDGFVLIIPNIIASLIIKFSTFGIFQSVLTSISGLLVSWIYFVLMTNKYQATVGKMAVGVKVVSDKAEKLDLKQIILRETIGKLLSMITLFIGYIMAGFTKRKQALHDKIAGTLVVYKDPNKKIGAWVIVVIILISLLMLIAIVGIFASIVLVSLNSARNKANDAMIRSSVSSVLPTAILYLDNKGSLNGFMPNFPKAAPECSENPIVNISKNGEQMAIFEKLCANDGKYFCADLDANSGDVDAAYAKSGATNCPSNN